MIPDPWSLVPGRARSAPGQLLNSLVSSLTSLSLPPSLYTFLRSARSLTSRPVPGQLPASPPALSSPGPLLNSLVPGQLLAIFSAPWPAPSPAPRHLQASPLSSAPHSPGQPPPPGQLSPCSAPCSYSLLPRSAPWHSSAPWSLLPSSWSTEYCPPPVTSHG